MHVMKRLSVSIVALLAFGGAPASAQLADHTWTGITVGDPNVGTVNPKPIAKANKTFPPPPQSYNPETGGTGNGGGGEGGGQSDADGDGVGENGDANDGDAGVGSGGGGGPGGLSG